MKQIIAFINKLTDYIDLGIFYLGYIFFFVGTYYFLYVINRYYGMMHMPQTMLPGLTGSIMGVYFIRSYKKIN